MVRLKAAEVGKEESKELLMNMFQAIKPNHKRVNGMTNVNDFNNQGTKYITRFNSGYRTEKRPEKSYSRKLLLLRKESFCL